MFEWQVTARSGKARAGAFTTPHGILKTPVFAPVGTQATVKAITPAQLHELGAQLVLANTYHLHLRPGSELVAEMGGLHQFMQWDGPMLTDSGGFQVFPGGNAQDRRGRGQLKSHIDGSAKRLSPEISIAIQENLGADIIMAFDECADPRNKTYSAEAMKRTHAWAKRCLKVKKEKTRRFSASCRAGFSMTYGRNQPASSAV